MNTSRTVLEIRDLNRASWCVSSAPSRLDRADIEAYMFAIAEADHGNQAVHRVRADEGCARSVHFFSYYFRRANYLRLYATVDLICFEIHTCSCAHQAEPEWNETEASALAIPVYVDH